MLSWALQKETHESKICKLYSLTPYSKRSADTHHPQKGKERGTPLIWLTYFLHFCAHNSRCLALCCPLYIGVDLFHLLFTWVFYFYNHSLFPIFNYIPWVPVIPYPQAGEDEEGAKETINYLYLLALCSNNTLAKSSLNYENNKMKWVWLQIRTLRYRDFMHFLAIK